MDFNNLPLLLTVPQAAEALGCSRSTVYNLIKSGRLETVDDLTAHRRIPRKAVLAIAGEIGK